MSAVQAWPVMGYILIAVAIVSVIYLLAFRKNTKSEASDESQNDTAVEAAVNEARGEGLGDK